MKELKIEQMATLIRIQNKVEEDVNGSIREVWADAAPPTCFCNWQKPSLKAMNTVVESGLLAISELAQVRMWYRPDISVKTRLLLNGDEDQAYRVLSIDNTEQRNKYIMLMVQADENI